MRCLAVATLLGSSNGGGWPPIPPPINDVTRDGYAVVFTNNQKQRPKIYYTRNPKAGSTFFLEQIAGVKVDPHRPDNLSHSLVCGSRLSDASNRRHQVGCFACKDGAPGAKKTFVVVGDETPTIGESDVQSVLKVLGGRARLTIIREPWERFVSAWDFYQAHGKISERYCMADFIRGFARAIRSPSRLLPSQVQRFEHEFLHKSKETTTGNPPKKIVNVVFWPQAFWVGPIIRGTPDATAVVVCYDRDAYQKRLLAALRSEFACTGPFDHLDHQAPSENSTKNASSVCDNEAADLPGLVRHLYAEDTALWSAYCERKGLALT